MPRNAVGVALLNVAEATSDSPPPAAIANNRSDGYPPPESFTGKAIVAKAVLFP
ncbi:MAG: hypothetical protein O3A37_13925 [Planctomycetota bacterium]|nr:hypothetical protein [Planctomycetota bacterium]